MSESLTFTTDASSGIVLKKNSLFWQGGQYPAYVILSLNQICELSSMVLKTPKKGFTRYRIYTSLDGRDYSLAYHKAAPEKCPADGETIRLSGRAAYLMVYIEYCSESVNAVIERLEVCGEPTGEPVPAVPEITVPDFENTSYAAPITPEDTVREVYGIIGRVLGPEYRDWFKLVLDPAAQGFTLEDAGSQIRVTAATGVDLAAGVNYYLKYYCNVCISQQSRNTEMPFEPVPVLTPVHKTTRAAVRYAYNYCTHSYTMPFWGEKEWRDELDYLALNGVNAVLDLTGLEEVWRRFLTRLGYRRFEIKNFLTGPAYYAWQYMANISGFGGPIHDSWFEERTELARKNHRIMRTLGMSPILQVYNGMVPADIEEKRPTVKLMPSQGLWNGFPRPAALKTTHPCYIELARLFYDCQREVYGDVTRFFAGDLFHEGGNSGTMSVSKATQIVMDQLLDYRPDARWIIQGWGENPRSSMLSGLRKYRDHCLILDLYAEKRPLWKQRKEFKKRPWAYCVLVNFGGRMGVNGPLKTVFDDLQDAMANAKYFTGVGITPEASGINPIFADMLFDIMWGTDLTLDQWLEHYARRRYGESENAYRALNILKNTAYGVETCGTAEGSPDSLLNARPCQDVKKASTWSDTDIRYDKILFEQAARMLAEDYDRLSKYDTYCCDLADVLRQVLANAIQEYTHKIDAALRAKDSASFDKYAQKLLGAADWVDSISAARPETMVGTWIQKAKDRAADTDDLRRYLYPFNARALITTWGSLKQANDGQLKDYANRQWSGLTKDFYKARWAAYLNAAREELSGARHQETDWFPMEWRWVLDEKEYPTAPVPLNLKSAAEKILEEYSCQE